MSWFDPRDWFGDDEPVPKPAPKPVPSVKEPVRLGAWGRPDTSDPGRITARTFAPNSGVALTSTRNASSMAPPAPPMYDPAGASRFTQRYLSSAGWGGQLAPRIDTGDQWTDLATVTELGPHTYELTDWQQEQARQSYGVKPPEESQRITGDAVRYGKANLADYETLTPQQKNAMRFNDLLVAAVEADRQAAVAPEMQDTTYQSRLQEMFGTQGGSEVYAPNTLALLEKMGMGRLRGQDLDEYLSLDRAYDVGEIQNLQPWDTTPEVGGYNDYGTSAGAGVQLALDQRQIDLTGSLIEQALKDTTIRGWSEQARLDTYLGRRPPADEIPFGYLLQGESRSTDLDNEKEAVFQKLYGYLSSSANTNLDELWAATQGRNFTDQDYNELFDYFYTRSLDDDRIGPQEGFRTGQEVRDFIGIG